MSCEQNYSTYWSDQIEQSERGGPSKCNKLLLTESQRDCFGKRADYLETKLKEANARIAELELKLNERGIK